METSPQKLKRDEKVALEAHNLFQFFTEAERNNQHFTYKQIRKHFPRKALTRHARNFWSWFLHNERQVKGTEYTFSCKGLLDYPVEYFIAAHKHNQGQYFAHFAKAMSDARARADDAREEKKKAMELQLPLPEVFEAGVPGQQAPQEIHTENIAIDEEETAIDEEGDLLDEEEEEERQNVEEWTKEEEKTPAQVTLTPTLSEYQAVYLEPLKKPAETPEEQAVLDPPSFEIQEPLAQQGAGQEPPHETENHHPTERKWELFSDNLSEREQPASPVHLPRTSDNEGKRVLLIIGVILLVLVVLAVILWLIKQSRD